MTLDPLGRVNCATKGNLMVVLVALASLLALIFILLDWRLRKIEDKIED